jgi:hypothetical protein
VIGKTNFFPHQLHRNIRYEDSISFQAEHHDIPDSTGFGSHLRTT